jgi:hypothetical protein
VGEPLYVTVQVLSVDDKRLHVFHRLHRGRRQQLIATGRTDVPARRHRRRQGRDHADAALRAKLDILAQGACGPCPRPPKPAPVGSRAALSAAMPKIVDHAQRRDEIATSPVRWSPTMVSSRLRWRALPVPRAIRPAWWRITTTPSRTLFWPRCAYLAAHRGAPDSRTAGQRANLLTSCPRRCRSMRSASPSAPSGWLLGTGVRRQEAQASERLGASRVHAPVRALPRRSIGRTGQRWPHARDQVLRSVVIHQRIDRQRRHEPARLAGRREQVAQLDLHLDLARRFAKPAHLKSKGK